MEARDRFEFGRGQSNLVTLVGGRDKGNKSYLADRGDFITVLNLPTALLDVPIQSDSALGSRLFEGFTERLPPPPGTPVTLILKPKLDRAEQ